MYCKNCGNQLNEKEKFCSKCGANIESSTDNKDNAVYNNMKKNTGFWVGLFLGEFILFLILIIISTISTISNIKNNGTDANTFINYMESNGYSVQKDNNYSSSYINDYYIASKNSYQVDFIKATNDTYAYNIFNQFVNQIETNTGNISTNIETISSNNYNKYAITTNGNSYIVAKSGNTVMYTAASSEYREELNLIFADLGYGSSNGFGMSFYITMILMIILVVTIYWKIFEKAGLKGWYSLIPIYNIYILTKIAYGKGIYLLLLFIPLANFIFIIMLWYKLAKAFGKSDGFAICNIFFSWITLQIIAFDDSKYIKQQA